jgi:hypothetical protein
MNDLTHDCAYSSSNPVVLSDNGCTLQSVSSTNIFALATTILHGMLDVLISMPQKGTESTVSIWVPSDIRPVK